MPSKRWDYHCQHGTCSGGRERCTECGEAGTFDGWHGNMYECMAGYSRLYRLKPVGPHQELANEVFEGTTRPCPRCGGRGYLGVNEDRCRPCERCASCRELFVLPPEEVEVLRRSVITAFPDAAVDPPPVEGPFLFEHATGRILSVTELELPRRKSKERGRGDA